MPRYFFHVNRNDKAGKLIYRLRFIAESFE
jgi:hypothetical protein